MKKLSAILVAISMFGSAAAHAAFQSKSQLSNRVSARTNAAQSAVVGYSKNRKIAYIRSEGSRNGQKYIITRQVNTNTGKIIRTSGNQLGKIKQAVSLANHNGAPGGQSGDRFYSIRVHRNAMTDRGHINFTAVNSGFPGRNEGRLATLTKTGAVKKVSDSAKDGLKSRW
jgi:hypothetical protein